MIDHTDVSVCLDLFDPNWLLTRDFQTCNWEVVWSFALPTEGSSENINTFVKWILLAPMNAIAASPLKLLRKICGHPLSCSGGMSYV